MKKLLITAAVAAIAAVPGITGLAGNASFAQSVPVQVPAGATTLDGHSRHAEPGDSHGRQAEPGDSHGRQAGPGDDRGQRAEPGDDRGGASSPDAAASTRAPGVGQASGSVTAGDGGPGRGGHDDGPADR